MTSACGIPVKSTSPMISQYDIYRFTDYISQIIKIDGNPVVKPIEHVGFSIPPAFLQPQRL
jgi:hypothetical protein